MIIMKTIKERLVEEIKLSGMTNIEISKKVGVSSEMVAQYKTTKKMPTLETFARLCRLLGVSADYILGIRENC